MNEEQVNVKEVNFKEMSKEEVLTWKLKDLETLSDPDYLAYTDRMEDFDLPIPEWIDPAIETSKEKKKKSMEIEEYIEAFESLGVEFRYNELSSRKAVSEEGDVLTEITDIFMDDFTMQFKKYCTINGFSFNEKILFHAIGCVARKNAYHPIKDYFKTLPTWDGVDRLSEMARCFPDPWSKRYLELWMCCAIRKIYEEDTSGPMLILNGIQGIGKSSFIRWICPIKKYFVEDTMIKPTNKDHLIRSTENFVWECPKLKEATHKMDFEDLKAFLTSSTQTIRKPYAQNEEVKPVLCSYMGTINNVNGFLTDATGNRRFIILNIERIDWSYLKIDKNQLWAQIYQCYLAGKAEFTAEDKVEQIERNQDALEISPVDTFLDDSIEQTEEDEILKTSDILTFLKNKGISLTGYTNQEVAGYFLKKYNAKPKAYRKNSTRTRGYKGFKWVPSCMT